jgi:hypothetical protein
MGDGFVSQVSARYAGTYQWTVNFDLPDDEEKFAERRLQLKFGPSAWFANEKDPNWKQTVDPEVADYSRLFLRRAKTKEVRQSEVTLQEVLDGLAPSDRRLHDEIVQLLSDSDRPASSDQKAQTGYLASLACRSRPMGLTQRKGGPRLPLPPSACGGDPQHFAYDWRRIHSATAAKCPDLPRWCAFLSGEGSPYGHPLGF